MEKPVKESFLGKIRKFFAQLSDKIDKKMETETKSKSCCCGPNDKKNKSCCS